MPSAYKVPMASDVLPEPDTPTTATVRHSGTSTSTSRRLLCLAAVHADGAGQRPRREIVTSGHSENLRRPAPPRARWAPRAAAGPPRPGAEVAGPPDKGSPSPRCDGAGPVELVRTQRVQAEYLVELAR